MRFWNDINAGNEKSALPAVSNFSHLKDLLAPEVKVLINGLSFHVERYERAEGMLESVYGKLTEIVKARVQQIVGYQVLHIITVQKFS